MSSSGQQKRNKKKSLKKQNSIAFDESEQQFRTFIEHCPDGIYVHDGKEILYANMAAAILFGAQSPDQVIGRSPLAHVPRDKRKNIQDNIKEAFKTEKTVGKNEQVFIRLDGSLIDIEVQATPATYNNQPALMVIARDITDGKDAERALKKSHEQLELRVQDRTWSLEQEITERIYAEQALSESEARFRQVAESFSGWIWETDARHRYTFVNDNLAKSKILPTQELLGKTRKEWARIAGWSYDAKHWREMEKLIQNHQPFENFEYSFETEGGRRVFMSVDAVPFFDNNGKFKGYRGATRNVTDIKVAQANLEKNAQLAEMLHKTAANANDAQNFAQALQLIIDEVCITTGWPIGHAFILEDEKPNLLVPTDLWHKKRSKKFATFRQATMEINFKIGQGLPGCVLKSGQPAWIIDIQTEKKFPRTKLARDLNIHSGFALPVLSESEVVAVLEFFTTETLDADTELLKSLLHIGTQVGRVYEREQAQKIILDREQRFRDFTAAGSDRFWETDENHKYKFVSPPIRAATTPSKYFVGNLIWECTPVQDNRAVVEKMRENFESHEPFNNFQFDRITDENVRLHMHMSGIPTFDSNGNFKGYRGTTNDQSEVVQARIEAQSANQAKSNFLSSMSHELRTPLNAVLGFGQLLQYDTNTPLSDTQNENVGIIIDAGHHLLELINQILDLARIEVGNIKLSIEPISVELIIEECVVMTTKLSNDFDIKVYASAKNIKTSYLKSDFTRCLQVLINFVSNAIKYNNVGGKVNISYRETKSQMGRFSVKDTGNGIPLDKQKELFQPFSRLGREASEIEGTGIGLTITKQLVEIMGGNLGFTSTVGKGSTFWFELPLASKQNKPTI